MCGVRSSSAGVDSSRNRQKCKQERPDLGFMKLEQRTAAMEKEAVEIEDGLTILTDLTDDDLRTIFGLELND